MTSKHFAVDQLAQDIHLRSCARNIAESSQAPALLVTSCAETRLAYVDPAPSKSLYRNFSRLNCLQAIIRDGS